MNVGKEGEGNRRLKQLLLRNESKKKKDDGDRVMNWMLMNGNLDGNWPFSVYSDELI